MPVRPRAWPEVSAPSLRAGRAIDGLWRHRWTIVAIAFALGAALGLLAAFSSAADATPGSTSAPLAPGLAAATMGLLASFAAAAWIAALHAGSRRRIGWLVLVVLLWPAAFAYLVRDGVPPR